jgi:uncharacterized membrane protein
MAKARECPTAGHGHPGGALDRTPHLPHLAGMASHLRARTAGLAGGDALPPLAVGTMLLLCAAWGFNMVAVKLAIPGIPPVLQAGLRSLVSMALLLGWCRWQGIGFGDWRRDGTLAPGILVGLLFGLEFLVLYIGIGLTTASRAVVFLYGAPFFVALGAHYLLPDDRLTPAKASGLAVAFGGLILAFAEGLRQPAGEGGRCWATRSACWAGRSGPRRRCW